MVMLVQMCENILQLCWVCKDRLFAAECVDGDLGSSRGAESEGVDKKSRAFCGKTPNVDPHYFIGEAGDAWRAAREIFGICIFVCASICVLSAFAMRGFARRSVDSRNLSESRVQHFHGGRADTCVDERTSQQATYSREHVGAASRLELARFM